MGIIKQIIPVNKKEGLVYAVIDNEGKLFIWVENIICYGLIEEVCSGEIYTYVSALVSNGDEWEANIPDYYNQIIGKIEADENGDFPSLESLKVIFKEEIDSFIEKEKLNKEVDDGAKNIQ